MTKIEEALGMLVRAMLIDDYDRARHLIAAIEMSALPPVRLDLLTPEEWAFIEATRALKQRLAVEV